MGITVAEAVAYVERSFDHILMRAECPAGAVRGLDILELGPGDTVGLALRFIAAGARRVTAVDRFVTRHDETRQAEIYRALRATLSQPEQERFDGAVQFVAGRAVLNRERIQLLQGQGIEDIALEPASFDLVMSIAVAEHLRDPRAALSSMDRLLRPGGRMWHQVDLRDHGMFSAAGKHALTYLTIPQPVYRLMVSNVGGPNRFMVGDYRAVLDSLGYQTRLLVTHALPMSGGAQIEENHPELVEGIHYTELDTTGIEQIRPRLRPRFRHMPTEDLLVSGVFIDATKRPPVPQKGARSASPQSALPEKGYGARAGPAVQVSLGRWFRSHGRGRGAKRHYDVAFYVPWVGPLLAPGKTLPPGGAETQIVLLARALARNGIRPCLIAYRIAEPLPRTIDGVDVLPRSSYRHHRFAGKVTEIFRIWRSLADANTDVIVARGCGPEPGVIALFARATRRMFVYSSANVIDFDFARLERRWQNVALFHLGLRLADELIVQTDEQLEMCEGRLHRRPALIRSIAEPADERMTSAEAFLWIGRMVDYKRPLAYVDLARAVPEARFWMVGVPSPRAAESELLMEQAAAWAERLPNLELLAPRPRMDLMDLIGRAVAIVNTAEFEGMPNIFLEGWARGVPALAFSHDPDGVIEHHGIGAFADSSVERLVTSARVLWEGRTDRAELAQRSRAYVQQEHSADAVAKRWLAVLGLESRLVGMPGYN